MTPAIHRLLRAPHSVNLSRLWRALPLPMRLSVAQSWAKLASGQRSGVRTALGQIRKIRPQTVASWSDERVARSLAGIDVLNPALVADLLMTFHLTERVPLLVAFLDALGVPHENGLISDASTVGASLSSERHETLRASVQHILTQHSHADVQLYLLTLRALDDKTWQLLDPYLALLLPVSESPSVTGALEGGSTPLDDVLASGQVSSTTRDVASATDDDLQHGGSHDEARELTILDELLIRAVVDSVEEAAGAKDADQIEDALLEVLQLNSSRIHSYYHLGFFDGVHRRTFREPSLGDNPARRSWYAAGKITALARRDAYDDIVALYDSREAVRELGGGGSYASRSTVYLIVEALCRCGRETEAARFVSPNALSESSLAAQRLASHATRLLREQRAAEARLLFDRLDAARLLVDDGTVCLSTDDPFWTDVRRRRANCYRQLGDLETARTLLLPMIDLPLSAGAMQRVLTDLGLIAAGYRNLASVTLPTREEDRVGVLENLSRGEEWFARGLDSDPSGAGHAAYCLGVLALLRRRPEQAVPHLETAYGDFASQREVYEYGGLLSKARLCLGLAHCLVGVGGPRLLRASSLIGSALADGSSVPDYLIDDVLLALMLSADTEVQALVELMLKQMPEHLERIIGVEAAHSSLAVGDALVSRMNDAQASLTSRCRLSRDAFAILRAQSRFDEAEQALTLLEEGALHGLEQEWFLTLLSDEERYGPVWRPEEALSSRVGVLTACGREQEAVNLLRLEVYRVIDRGPDYLPYAIGLVDEVRERGSAFAALAGELAEALAAREPPLDIGDTTVVVRPVRVIVIGGDERQAPYVDPIRHELAGARPDITVEFVRTGWGSNWMPHVDALKRRIERHEIDSVVILRFVRTNCGGAVRRAVGDVPWIACPGHGRQAIRLAIVRAADVAQRLLRS